MLQEMSRVRGNSPPNSKRCSWPVGLHRGNEVMFFCVFVCQIREWFSKWNNSMRELPPVWAGTMEGCTAHAFFPATRRCLQGAWKTEVVHHGLDYDACGVWMVDDVFPVHLLKYGQRFDRISRKVFFPLTLFSTFILYKCMYLFNYFDHILTI